MMGQRASVTALSVQGVIEKWRVKPFLLGIRLFYVGECMKLDYFKKQCFQVCLSDFEFLILTHFLNYICVFY